MPQVIFYLLSSDAMTADLFACRLADKAWHEGYSVHLQMDDSIASKQMDKLLWSWREDSFLPHAILSEDSAHQKAAPITIGHDAQPDEQTSGMLINMATTLPRFYHQFQRICEIVTQDANSTELSRKKFRMYQQAGIKPKTYKM
ncbi:DNA polymerase III subunit chi [Endozoicomonas sp. Mp262]|uniref:DNA polymerase III subunit chi n=1 Tax=Endozoicomonas sp. Mp262 TaxID=2919499 RepID=UPI0021D873AD